MTKAQNIKFLMDLGIPEAQAKKMSIGIPDSGVDELPGAELEEALTSAVTHQRELYTNGDDYKTNLKKVKNDAAAEVFKKAQKRIMTVAGLSAEDVKDLDYDAIVELAWTKVAKKGSKSEEELQAALNEATGRLKTLEEEEIPKIKGEVENEKKNFKIENALLAMITTSKIRKGVDVDDMVLLIRNKAKKSGYIIDIDDKGNITMTNEDGSKINTEDKKNFMQPKDIVTKFLDPYLEKSGAPDPDDKKKGTFKGDDDDDDDSKGGGNGSKKKLGSFHKTSLSKAEEHAQKLGE